MADVEIDEVRGFAQQARFFRQKDKDYIEISFIGNPDTLIQKVTPELMARYRDEWNAYCDGTPMKQRPGTALTEIKEMTPERAAELIRRNVHNLEELAALNDHQCQGLGHGTMTLRRTAQGIVQMRKFQEKEVAQKKINESVAPAMVHHPEMNALEDMVKAQAEKIDTLSNAVAALVEMQKQSLKPVTRKKKNGPKLDTGNNEPGV